MNELASLWIGDTLSGIEQLSAASFLAQGNRLTIYTYEAVRGIPDGVDVADANEVFPCERILRYPQNGSPALHSNLFRYALLQKTDKIWVDLDMVALRPFDFAGDHVFGLEAAGEINSAVLRLPKASPALQKLARFRPDSIGYPPFTSFKKGLKWYLRTFGLRQPIERWPWGSTGPRALTHYLRQTGEIKHALPRAAFFPFSWRELDRMLEPGAVSLSDLDETTYGVHLWGKFLHQHIAGKYGGEIPPGSLIDQMFVRYRDGKK
ncbi:MAG: hypothetical protein ACC631_10510 [Halocynthiibacter sp.]